MPDNEISNISIVDAQISDAKRDAASTYYGGDYEAYMDAKIRLDRLRQAKDLVEGAKEQKNGQRSASDIGAVLDVFLAPILENIILLPIFIAAKITLPPFVGGPPLNDEYNFLADVNPEAVDAAKSMRKLWREFRQAERKATSLGQWIQEIATWNDKKAQLGYFYPPRHKLSLSERFISPWYSSRLKSWEVFDNFYVQGILDATHQCASILMIVHKQLNTGTRGTTVGKTIELLDHASQLAALAHRRAMRLFPRRLDQGRSRKYKETQNLLMSYASAVPELSGIKRSFFLAKLELRYGLSRAVGRAYKLAGPVASLKHVRVLFAYRGLATAAAIAFGCIAYIEKQRADDPVPASTVASGEQYCGPEKAGEKFRQQYAFMRYSGTEVTTCDGKICKVSAITYEKQTARVQSVKSGVARIVLYPKNMGPDVGPVYGCVPWRSWGIWSTMTIQTPYYN